MADQTEQRVHQLRWLTFPAYLLPPAYITHLVVNWPEDPRVMAAYIVAAITMHILYVMPIRLPSDGRILMQPSEFFVALSLAGGFALGVPPMDALVLVLLVLLSNCVGTREQMRLFLADRMRRIKVATTTVMNVGMMVPAYALFELMVSQWEGPGGYLTGAFAAAAVWGMSTSVMLLLVASWAGGQRPAIITVVQHTVYAWPLAAAGVLLTALIVEVGVVALLFTAVAVAPLPALVLRRIKLETEHEQIDRLFAIASGRSTGSTEESTEDIATAIADIMGYRHGELRAEPPVPLQEIGSQLGNGTWVVLTGMVGSRAAADGDDQGRLDGLVALADPLIDAVHGKEALSKRVQTDPLTNLANRAGLENFVESCGPDAPIAVVYLDLNDFKPVNDTYGHAAGDAVLTELGARFNAEVRSNDLAARTGGDEFVIVLARIDDEETAWEAANRIIEKVLNPFELPDGTIVSIGIAAGLKVGLAADFDTLLDQADSDMYERKTSMKHADSRSAERR